MKKLFLMLFITSLFAISCDSDNEGEEKITITFATSIYVEDPHRLAIDELISTYNEKNPNINVEVYGAGFANFWDNLTVEIMGGNESDIIQMYPFNVASMNSLRMGGVFEDLIPYMEEKDYLSDFTGQDMCVVDGEILALSTYSWGTTALFYRKSILEKYGIDPQSIKTWDDFVEASEILQQNGVIGMGVVDSSHGFVVSEWARMIARVVSDGLYFPNGETGPFTASDIQVNSEKNIWAAKQWQDYIYKNKLGKSAPDKKDSREYFWNGLAAFNYDGPWFIGMSEQRDADLLNEDIGIIPSPSVEYDGKLYKPNPTMYPLVSSISKNSEYKQEAFDFLEWMGSSEAQKIVAKCGMIPSNKEYALSDEYKKAYPTSVLFAEFLDTYATQVSDPMIPQQGELDTILINATQEIFAAGKDPKTVLDEAAKKCMEVMNR